MNDELKVILLILGASIPVGLLIGITIRKTSPEWSKAFVKYSLNQKWWIFAFGMIMGLGCSSASFLLQRYYFGFFFLLFVGLEMFALVKYGFKRLTPEQAAEIDASDPTKRWSFWKQPKNR